MRRLCPPQAVWLLTLWIAPGPGASFAQDTARPPAAPSRTPGVSPAADSADSAARARERAAVDSIRRKMVARGESILRARRSAAGLPAEPARSPLFGDAPFYGYNWVFYADLLVGALTGLIAVRLRRRDEPAGARVVWMIVGALFGALGAAAVFLPVFLLNALLSVGFSAMPPALMFGLTFGVILVTAGSVALSRRRH